MQILKGESCYLRALEEEDLDFLFDLENDVSLWELGGTLQPYSKEVLRAYIQNSSMDIYAAKQLRFCICSHSDEVIGLIDLFEFDPKNRRAGVGIVIAKESDRKKGYGNESLELLKQYAFTILDLHQLYANILKDNQASLSLFTKSGFEVIGNKRDWIYWNGNYKDELMLQIINQDSK